MRFLLRLTPQRRFLATLILIYEAPLACTAFAHGAGYTWSPTILAVLGNFPAGLLVILGTEWAVPDAPGLLFKFAVIAQTLLAVCAGALQWFYGAIFLRRGFLWVRPYFPPYSKTPTSGHDSDNSQ